MASRDRVKYSAIPRNNDKHAISTIASIIETLVGAKGDKLEKAVTYRDLQNSGIANIISRAGDYTLTPVINNDGQSDAVLDGVATPTQPKEVVAHAGIGIVVLMWERAAYPGHAYTEIWRASVVIPEDGSLPETPPTIGDAINVGSTSYNIFRDNADEGQYHYYWVRHVNLNSVEGPWNATDGILAVPYPNPSELIYKYSQELYSSEIYQWLRDDFDYVNTVSELSGLPDNHPFIQFINAAGNYDDVLGELALQGAIVDHQTTINVSASTLNSNAQVKEMVTTVAAENYAFASRMAVLESSYNNMGAQIDAKIADYNTALTSEFGAIATAINQITASYNGTDVTLQELASAAATADGRYTAQWGVKSAVGDLQGGVGFYNDGELTQFLVDANVFAVTNGDGNTDAVAPFIVRDGKVYISEAYIDVGVVSTLIAELLVAENIIAGVSINSPIIDGGSIIGTTLNINDKFLVDAFGNMNAENATVKGHVEASSGTIDNVTITDTCVIEGSIYAKNIEGDVYNEKVYPLNQILGGSNHTTLYTATVAPLSGSVAVRYTRSIKIPSVFVTYKSSGNANLNVTMRVLRDGVEIYSDTASMSTVLDVIGNTSQLTDYATLTGGVFDVIGKASSTVFTVEIISSTSVVQNANESLTVSRDFGGGDSVNVALYRAETSLS